MYGIGLQTDSEPLPSGITGISMYGSADSQITSFLLSQDPTLNSIIFVSEELGKTFVGHPLSDILGVSFEELAGLEEFSLEVKIIVPSNNFNLILQCPRNYIPRCTVTWKRELTPKVYYLSPRVVYKGSDTSIHLDSTSSNYLANSGATLPVAQIDMENMNFLGRSQNNDELLITQGILNEIKAINTDQLPNAQSDFRIKLASGEAYPMPTMPVCLPDLTCYSVKTVATITSISSHQGYSSGGKTITIHGFGFYSPDFDPQITIDGVECTLIHPYTNTEVKCITQGGDIPEIKYQKGECGIKRRIYFSEIRGHDIPTFSNYQTYPEQGMQLYTTTENNQDIVECAMVEYEGLFVPLVSGRHRFNASCDHQCQIYISSDIDPANAQLYQEVQSPTAYRNYDLREDFIAEWIEMVAGESYYIKILHREGTRADHMTVSVEIENEGGADEHPQSFPEIQNLVIHQTQSPDIISWDIVNGDDGYYRLIFYNFDRIGTALASAHGVAIDIPADATASQIRSLLYSNIYGSILKTDIQVKRTTIDAQTRRIEIIAKKALDQFAILQISQGTPAYDLTHSGAVIQNRRPSNQGGTVFRPLEGYFQIKCFDFTQLQYITTTPISVEESVKAIKQKIFNACPDYRYNLEVSEGTRYSKLIENGRDLILTYYLKKDVPLMQIVKAQGPFNDDGDYPPVSGLNEYLYSEVVRPYSKNLFYYSIPFEMLKTLETLPQLQVQIGGLPAVCIAYDATQNDFNCDFKYIPTPECNAYFDGAILVFDCDVEDGCKVKYGDSECTDFTENNVNYGGATTCEFDQQPNQAGNYEIMLKCPEGEIPTGTTGTNPIITEIQPGCINFLGGQTLRVIGQNFPQNLQGNVITINFEIDNSECQIFSVTQQEIKCTVPQFSVYDQPTKIEICINGLCDNSFEVEFCDIPTPVVLSYFPNPVSPVLRTDMEFTLDFIPDGAFDINDYTIYFESVDNPGFKRYPVIQNVEKIVTINGQGQEVIEYKISVRFLGSYSGKYQIHISHSDLGDYDTSQLPLLDVNGYIYDFFPKYGSPCGGTEITIIGDSFSENQEYGTLENNVKIGNTDCIVFFSSKTMIKCITQKREPDQTEGKEELEVFLKAAEYAICQNAQNPECHFEWTLTDLPTVDSILPVWDENEQIYYVEITGSGFQDQFKSDTVTIDGVVQPAVLEDDGLIRFPLFLDSSFDEADLDIVFVQGRVDISALKEFFTADPRFIGFNTNEGSEAGSLITATVRGIGQNAQNVDFQLQNGDPFCEEITIISFEQIQCKTLAQPVTLQDIKFIFDGEVYECEYDDLCSYQTTQPLTPEVTSIDEIGNDLILYGSGFLSANDFEAYCFYAGVFSQQANIVSSTEVRCPYQYGVPNTLVALKPVLWFKDKTSTITHWSKVVVPKPANTNPSFSAAPVTCSVHGGCPLTIQGEGVASDLRNSDHAVVKVCGQICDFVQELSNANEAICYLRECPDTLQQNGRLLQTSENNLNLKELQGTVIGSNIELANRVFSDTRGKDEKNAQHKNDQQSRHLNHNSNNNHVEDQNDIVNQEKEKAALALLEQQENEIHYNAQGWDDPKANCYFGIQFEDNFVGRIGKIQYFIPPATEVKYIIGHLHFQGSNDNINWEDIYTIGEEIIWYMNNKQFQSGEQPLYKAYRFFGDGSRSCLIGNVKLYGELFYDNGSRRRMLGLGGSDDQECDVQLIYKDNNDQQIVDLGNQVTYSPTETPSCDSISPRFGSVKGGDTITINGDKFSTNKDHYTIIIDGIECEVQNGATTSQIQCLTGERIGYFDNSYMIFRIEGKGEVKCPYNFKYVYKWSDFDTWGGDDFPVDGESLWVPKGLSLLVDLDHPPQLKQVAVEGELIFNPLGPCPNEARTFDADYIFARGGIIQAGNEDFPMECCLTITLHGDRHSPEIPLYGNKAIGVRFGTIDLHGAPVSPSWVDLEESAQIGATSIKVRGPIGWQEGDEIVIASTSYDLNQAEERIISSVDDQESDTPVINFDTPLLYIHYAGEEYDGQDLLGEMRGEVGLLTRCLKIQGDQNSPIDRNGAILTVLSSGSESSTVRISNVEFKRVGQAYKTNRYPINVNVFGSMQNSYIQNNSIHESYNRAIALINVQDLRVTNNVAYNILGHAIFLENGIEIKNIIKNNLVINTYISWSLLNTDQAPAAYWISNPQNHIQGNRAAGSEAHGFWLDFPDSPRGVLNQPFICPSGNKLLEFEDNHAHSNQRYGLRLSNSWNPKKSQCKDLEETESSPAIMKQVVTWMNVINGVYLERIGDVKIQNFFAADNLKAGIEVAQTPFTIDETAKIIDAVVMGYTNNPYRNETHLDLIGNIGLITPRSENFVVDGLKFYNFDFENQIPIQPCSGCNQGRDFTDSGARTVTFKRIQFDSNSSPKRIRYIFPRRDILLDLDGTLSGEGSKTWVTPIWEHNKQKECKESVPNDSLFCDSTVQVRRIAIYGYQPRSLTNAEIEILQYDPIREQSEIDYNWYENDTSKYSVIPWKLYTDPDQGWALPFVTGYEYKCHWRSGIDFNRLSIDISERWEPEDKNLRIIFNHTDAREVSQITITNPPTNDPIEKDTLLSKDESEWESGDNLQLHQPQIRQLQILINGKNQLTRTITIDSYACLEFCPEEPKGGPGGSGPDDPCDGIRYWSIPADWDSGELPVEDEDVVIRRNCVVYFDMETTPVYNSVTVYGTVIWLNDDENLSLTMNTRAVFNRGTINIGEEGNRFRGILAQIRLFGTKFSPQVAIAPYIEGGNKMIANSGILTMFGIERLRVTRLKEFAAAGTNIIKVDERLGWKKGDQIAVLTSSGDWKASEDGIIEKYEGDTITLKEALLHDHWGDQQSTSQRYLSQVDIRAEVLLLTSNVKVTAEEEGTHWGCQIVTSDYFEHGYHRQGLLQADNIETYNCSQFDSFKSAIRFEHAKSLNSYVRHSAFHHGLGIGLQISYSANIEFEGNIFYDFIRFGGNLETSTDITLVNNFFAHIGFYENNFNYVKVNAGLLICLYKENDHCERLQIVSNTVVGAFYAGFGAFAKDCGANSPSFAYNIAHSNEGSGGIFVIDPLSNSQGNCLEVNTFYAYKNKRYGALTYTPTKEIRFRDMILIDNGIGTGTWIGKQGDDLKITIYGVHYYGETDQNDCQIENECLDNPNLDCINKAAIQLPLILEDFLPPFPRNASEPDIVQYDASWGGYIEMGGISFNYYPSSTGYCGGRTVLFESYSEASDYTPEVLVKDALLRDVSSNALVYFNSPDPAWKIIERCGEIDCTGLENVLVTFNELLRLPSGNVPFAVNLQPQPLSLVSRNPHLENFYLNSQGCDELGDGNGYICNKNNLGHLLFESLDIDKYQRTVSPIIITSDDLPLFENVLNSFMDKAKRSILLGQRKLDRFVTNIIADENTHYTYNISYTGSVPETQRFALKDVPSGIVVRIKYDKQNSYAVRNEIGGGFIDQNPFNKILKIQEPISEFEVCGENRYIGVDNILEFYIEPGCTLIVEPRNVVQASVRLEWTLQEFYANDGTTMFIDRLSAVLGIHPSFVKIVRVYEGSVIVESQILAVNDDEVMVASLTNKLEGILATNTTIFGQPLLDYEVTTPVKVNITKPIIVPHNVTTEQQQQEESQVPAGLSQSQLILVGALGGIALICALLLCICYQLCKKKKTVTIQVNDTNKENQKGENEDKVNKLNLTQEYEAQYHPKTEIGRKYFDDPTNMVAEKNLDDLVNDNEMGKDGSPTMYKDEWDSPGTDTVRTNTNRFTERGELMSPSTFRSAVQQNQRSQEKHLSEELGETEM